MRRSPPRLSNGHHKARFRIKIEPESEIIAALERAGTQKEVDVDILADDLSAAVNNFIDEKSLAQPRSEFRAELEAFSKAVDALIPSIPHAGSPLAAAIAYHWMLQTNQLAMQNYIDMRGVDPENRVAIVFPSPMAFITLGEGFRRLQLAIEKLKQEEPKVGRGRPVAEADHAFVGRLKFIYEQTTGVEAKYGQSQAGTNTTDRVGSNFGNFVRVVQNIVVQQHIERYTKEKIFGTAGKMRVATVEEARLLAEDVKVKSIEQSVKMVCES